MHLFCPLSLFSLSQVVYPHSDLLVHTLESVFVVVVLHRKFFGSLVVVPVKFTFVHILWSLSLHSSDALLVYEFWWLAEHTVAHLMTSNVWSWLEWISRIPVTTTAKVLTAAALLSSACWPWGSAYPASPWRLCEPVPEPEVAQQMSDHHLQSNAECCCCGYVACV